MYKADVTVWNGPCIEIPNPRSSWVGSSAYLKSEERDTSVPRRRYILPMANTKPNSQAFRVILFTAMNRLFCIRVDLGHIS